MGNEMQLTRNPVSTVNMGGLDRWISILSGGVLAVTGARQESARGRVMMLAGAEMLRRGVTGHSYAYQMLGVRTRTSGEGKSISVPYELGVHVRVAVTIGRPRNEVFAFWRRLENLPQAMRHLVSVQQTDARSHWIAKGLAGKQFEWDAELTNEIENELIAWRSLEGSSVDSAGSVQFKDAPGNRGTEILVELQYNPPAGYAGAYIAKLFGQDAASEIEADLFRLKQLLETGEIATTEGQPHANSRSKKMRQLNLAETERAKPVPVGGSGL